MTDKNFKYEFNWELGREEFHTELMRFINAAYIQKKVLAFPIEFTATSIVEVLPFLLAQVNCAKHNCSQCCKGGNNPDPKKDYIHVTDKDQARLVERNVEYISVEEGRAIPQPCPLLSNSNYCSRRF